MLRILNNKKRYYIVIIIIITKYKNSNLLHIEFMSIDKSIDKSILTMFCINKCVRARYS